MKEIKIIVIACFSYSRLFNFTTPSVSEQHQADAGYGAPGSVLECLRNVCRVPVWVPWLLMLQSLSDEVSLSIRRDAGQCCYC